MLRKKWLFKAGDDIPGILDESENSYNPIGIHKEFLGFAKIFRMVEKKTYPLNSPPTTYFLFTLSHFSISARSKIDYNL